MLWTYDWRFGRYQQGFSGCYWYAKLPACQ